MFLGIETKQAQPCELGLFRGFVWLVAVAIKGETTGVLLVVVALTLRRFVLELRPGTQRKFPVGPVERAEECSELIIGREILKQAVS